VTPAQISDELKVDVGLVWAGLNLRDSIDRAVVGF
jgi:hypothetical protein